MAFAVTVLGASGFAGGELLRILETHPGFQVVCAAGGSQVGRALSDAYPYLPSLSGMTLLPVQEALQVPAELVLSSLPHNQSMRIFANEGGPKVVDLAGDFRLHDPHVYEQWYGQAHARSQALGGWVYGLPEVHRARIQASTRVANPGCYATAALLALVPLLASGAIEAEGIHIDAKSGVSGAGRAGGEGFDFASVNEDVVPYRVTGHNHIAEMEQELSLAARVPVRVSFVPHVVPMTRGLLASCVARAATSASSEELTGILSDAYLEQPFVRVLQGGQLPRTRRVTGTNHAEVAVRSDARTGRVLAFGAVDNLVKGAAGQAVQNANLMFGFGQEQGLQAPPCLP